MFNNQPFAGGWRFGDRPSSVQSLYQAPQSPDNDFLKKVAALAKGQDPAKVTGLLDQSLEAQPLEGLLSGGRDVDQTAGGNSQNGPARGATSLSEGGNPQTQVSSAGFAPNMSAAMKGFMSGGLPAAAIAGLLGGSKTAPVYDLIMPGMNGYLGNNYGTSATLNGAPNAQQAQAIADSFGRDFGAFASMNGAPTAQQAQAIADAFARDFGGYSGGGSAGDSFGGAGGFGGGDYGDGTDR